MSFMYAYNALGAVGPHAASEWQTGRFVEEECYFPFKMPHVSGLYIAVNFGEEAR